MPNSIDDFLAKASPEQREKFEAQVKDAASGKPMSEAELTAKQAKETNDISQRNDPTKVQDQTSGQAPNAVDRAIDSKTKSEVAQIGKDLQKSEVSIPNKEDRDH